MIASPVADVSHVSEARRAAVRLSTSLGYSDEDSGRVALVATELATNIIKHGGGGELLIGTCAETGIELIAIDRGPGMADVRVSMQDGFSSAGTAGQGLGSIFRQSKFMDIASWPGAGTAILARLEPSASRLGLSGDRSSWGVVSIAKSGEEVCGDAWGTSGTAALPTALVADGLGHGPQAADAAVAAVRLFHKHPTSPIDHMLRYIHDGLRATRGAAAAIARIDWANNKVLFAGIGNVAGVVGSESGLKRLVSLPGTAGHVARRIQTFDYPLDGGTVIMHTDGLSTNWTLERLPNLLTHHPSLIAAVLYRDFARRRDDTTVLVVKSSTAP